MDSCAEHTPHDLRQITLTLTVVTSPSTNSILSQNPCLATQLQVRNLPLLHSTSSIGAIKSSQSSVCGEAIGDALGNVVGDELGDALGDERGFFSLFSLLRLRALSPLFFSLFVGLRVGVGSSIGDFVGSGVGSFAHDRRQMSLTICVVFTPFSQISASQMFLLTAACAHVTFRSFNCTFSVGPIKS